MFNKPYPFICKECGITGEKNFAWNGECLECDEGWMPSQETIFEALDFFDGDFND